MPNITNVQLAHSQGTSIYLPMLIEATVTASAKNGVLEIRLTKVANEVARQVPINKGS